MLVLVGHVAPSRVRVACVDLRWETEIQYWKLDSSSVCQFDIYESDEIWKEMSYWFYVTESYILQTRESTVSRNV